jgi:Protein of unknown function (DUF1592)/Protein of unknown function (DUF1588)/Protein of unknown function (DUF1595)/Protein of unknown function (DUF1585)
MTRPGTDPLCLALFGASLAMGLACTGTIGGSTGGGRQPGATGGMDDVVGPGGSGVGGAGPGGGGGVVMPPPGTQDWAGPAVFRRLTLVELQNSIRDLLGASMSMSSTDLTADAGTAVGFGVGAKFTNSVDALGFESLMGKVTDTAIAHLSTLVPASCNLMATSTGDQESCVKDFVDKFGLRTFRRPLLEKEKTDLLALYRALRATDTSVTMADAIGGLIKGMLQSPQFLYHWELTEPAQKDGMLVRYGDYELASRLSFFLWASTPDDKLLAAAAAGQLQDPKMLMTQARRLLGDGRAKDAVSDFHTQWLELAGLTGLSKDASYTKYTPAVAQAMMDETVAFAQSVLLGPNATGKLSDLFTSTSTFMNAPLAALYNVQGVTGDKMVPAKVNATERAGILTQGAFLATHADGDFDHPVKRGVTVLRHVVCLDVPPPPDNVDIPPLPERPQNVTTREFYSQHSKNAPLCASCHDAIDPMGFAFENYDAVGQYRTTEVGKSVDASGSVDLATSGKITFKNAVDLTTQLAKTPELRECVSRHWVRYLLRRQEMKEEKTTIDALLKAFDDSQGDLREVLVAVAGTKAFTHRQPFAGEQTR